MMQSGRKTDAPDTQIGSGTISEPERGVTGGERAGDDDDMSNKDFAATLRDRLRVTTNDAALAQLAPYLHGLAKLEGGESTDPNDR